MKKMFLFVLLSFFLSIQVAKAESIHAQYDAILKNYVIDGLVDYAGLKANRASLDEYLKNMAKVEEAEFKTWAKDQRLAYLINLYNAQTLKLIIDNYPLDSIKDLGTLFKSPWKIKFISLFAEQVHLDHIEHEIIRKEYNEPRIHLALVCAAFSCPPLRSEAYEGNILSNQLDSQGSMFFASPKGVQVDHKNKKVYLSSILKWYKEDFSSVTDFAQKYSKEDFQGYKLDWLEYDWKLNEK